MKSRGEKYCVWRGGCVEKGEGGQKGGKARNKEGKKERRRNL